MTCSCCDSQNVPVCFQVPDRISAPLLKTCAEDLLPDQLLFFNKIKCGKKTNYHLLKTSFEFFEIDA